MNGFLKLLLHSCTSVFMFVCSHVCPPFRGIACSYLEVRKMVVSFVSESDLLVVNSVLANFCQTEPHSESDIGYQITYNIINYLCMHSDFRQGKTLLKIMTIKKALK